MSFQTFSLFDLICECNLYQSLLLPSTLILSLWRVFSAAEDTAQGKTHAPSSLVLSSLFFSPCRSLWKIIGVHWEHYWFGIAVLKEKSELYFLQNTDQRGRNWQCFRGPFTSNLWLFSFFFLFLLFCLLVYFCLFSSTLFCLIITSFFCWFSLFLSQIITPSSPFLLLFQCHGCYSVQICHRSGTR